jgi:hypothetical protein
MIIGIGEKLTFSSVQQVDLPDEVANQFKWDRINILENLPGNEGLVVSMSDSSDKMHGFSTGLSEMMRILRKRGMYI